MVTFLAAAKFKTDKKPGNPGFFVRNKRRVAVA